MRKIPIGIQDFRELRSNGYVYVDKTGEILKLVNMNKYYFLPRPRRFGKSLLCSTMKYLFLGEKELFKGLYAENKWDWDGWNPVIYISFAGWGSNDKVKEYIYRYSKIYVKEDNKIKEKNFKEYLEENEFSRLSDIIIKLNEVYNKQVVILIDEYDRPVLNVLNDVDKAEELRLKFRDFYSGIKDIDEKIRLFFLTGITKILKMSIFSVLNNLKDLFYDSIAYKILGYTQEELLKYFSEDIEELGKKNGQSKEEVLKIMREYYNGYNFGDKDYRVYNPWDVNNLMLSKMYGMYWTQTGLPGSIEEYIKGRGIDIKDLIERVYKGELYINETELNLENLRTISAEVLLLTGGYLTVKDRDIMYLRCEFPNKQVESVVSNYFVKYLMDNKEVIKLQLISRYLIRGIRDKDKELIKQSIEDLLSVVRNVSYEWIVRNPEGWLKTLIMLVINLSVDFWITEKHFIRGRSDIILLMNGKKVVIEVKVDGNQEELKKQMERYKEEAENVIGINWRRKQDKVEIEII